MKRASYDVAVLGAGAAGLMAAIRAAERGRRVVLFEKNRKAGVKILMSGGTRCNVTNARGLHHFQGISGPVDPAFDSRQCRGHASIVEAFGPNGAFLRPALRAFGVEDTVAFFELEGVPLKIESNGKIFPVSDRAVDILNALLRRLERSGARLELARAVVGLERQVDQGLIVRLSDGDVQAHHVVLAVGGCSYPGSGTSGDGYTLARSLGHTIIDPRPALVPLRVNAEWIRDLRGVTLPDVNALIIDGHASVLAQRREALLFAHFGLTGPAILDISRAVTTTPLPQTLRLRLDFRPDTTVENLDTELARMGRAGGALVASLVATTLPRRLVDALLHECQIPRDRAGSALTREERKRLVHALKSTEMPIAGSLGFDKAEVTAGGVSLDELDPRTLESRVCPGLHLCGEVLDLDGLIGGYNFQAAWSTGWLAGSFA